MSHLQRLLKLRKMPPREIRVRIKESLRQRRERRLYGCRTGADPASPRADVKRLNAASVRGAIESLVPGSHPEQLQRLRNDFPQVYEQLASSAASRTEKILSGAWKLLGHPVDLQKRIDWHRDPRTDYRWPRTFYADLSLFELGDQIDVKYVWELGRQQYLVELARGWLFTHDEQFARRARDLMLDWIDCNPVFEGVHWTSGLELAMRSISWLWTIAALKEWDGWQTADMQRVAGSLVDHATYLEHHLSFYSSPYNHLMGEATALYLMGLALCDWDDAARWRDCGRRVLTDHGPRQFYSDGFCVEQATGYHFYTLGFLSLAIVAARAEAAPLRKLEQAVHQAYRAGAALRQPEGCWPAIGDVDSARSIPVAPRDFWDFGSLCNLGAVLFDDAGLKIGGKDPGEELYWLLGCEGLEAWKQLPDDQADSSVVLEQSGYAVARCGDDWLLLDAGPIADGLHADATPSTAHGHADALQVLFSTRGKPVLQDAGMPFYFGSREWVDHFRSPAAHNTIEIEGVTMARNAGRLAWSHVARQPRLDANLSDDVWLARGRAEWSPGVVVQRYLCALPGQGLWIADWINLDQPRRVRWFWQLPNGTVHQAEHDSPAQCLFTSDGIVMMSWSDSVRIDARIETARKNSPVGWHAAGYGTLGAGERICFEAEVADSILVATFVGLSPLPMEIFVHEQTLRCATSNDNESRPASRFPDGYEQYDAEIIWRVETGDETATYLAGVSTNQLDACTTPLSGVGGWPAIYRKESSELQRFESCRASQKDFAPLKSPKR